MSRVLRFLVLMILSFVLAACSSSGKGVHTGEMQLSDGRSFTCTLEFPESWSGKYEVRQEGNITWFDYSVNPDMKLPLFALTALTVDEWQAAQQEPGHGQSLMHQDGAVFVYNITLENLYSGRQAEEFQQMAGDVQDIVATLKVSAVN